MSIFSAETGPNVASHLIRCDCLLPSSSRHLLSPGKWLWKRNWRKGIERIGHFKFGSSRHGNVPSSLLAYVWTAWSTNGVEARRTRGALNNCTTPQLQYDLVYK